jgi:hypothetical protein
VEVIFLGDNEKLRYYMDESSAPYPEGENPFETTEEDKEFERKMIERIKNKVGVDDYV